MSTIFTATPEPQKLICGSVTFPEYDWATNGILVRDLGASEIPIWWPQTGSYETFSFREENL